MNVIVFKRPDGGVSMTTPNEISDPIEAAEHALKVDSNLEGSTYRICDISNLPTDRIFRDAWTDDYSTDTVDVDMNKAIEIHKNKLRELRVPLLAKLDADYMKADESGDVSKKLQIAKKKQALRDVTKLPNIKDPAELAAYIPEVLQ